jgi:D-glycero-beta-D-manno-heptose-7-phosphate kinase
MNFYHLDASQYVVLPFWANGQPLITNHVFPLRPLREVLCLAFLEKILSFLPPCPLRPLREALIFVSVVAPLYTSSMQPERFDQIAAEFSKKRLLVIGDVMLDGYVWGRVSRISPEAPVPVVEVVRESFFPGGAANVARNVRECGAEVLIMGLVGKDSAAERLRSILETGGIRLETLAVESGFQTILKTRIIARQQQVVRVDHERPHAVSPDSLERCLAQITEMLPGLDGIIFEDYGKGFVVQTFVNEVTRLARAAGKVITADPNPHNPIEWKRLTAVKPNRSEAFAAANVPWQEPETEPLTDRNLLEAGKRLLQRWEPDQLLITLGEQGMMLFCAGDEPHQIPPQAREIFDLSGAGDTAIALFTLALVCGATPLEAAEISNHASGVVVAKLGTATVTPAEIRESLSFS